MGLVNRPLFREGELMVNGWMFDAAAGDMMVSHAWFTVGSWDYHHKPLSQRYKPRSELQWPQWLCAGDGTKTCSMGAYACLMHRHMHHAYVWIDMCKCLCVYMMPVCFCTGMSIEPFYNYICLDLCVCTFHCICMCVRRYLCQTVCLRFVTASGQPTNQPILKILVAGGFERLH